MPNESHLPSMSSFFPSYISAGRLVTPMVPLSANTQLCVFDNKGVIFDFTTDRIIMRHRLQTRPHLSLNTACEKRGQLALVPIGRFSSRAPSSPSSSSSSSRYTSWLTHPDSTFSCNLSCSSHALAGEYFQRICRVQTVCIDNGRRHYLGFCQCSPDHIALRTSPLSKWLPTRP